MAATALGTQISGNWSSMRRSNSFMHLVTTSSRRRVSLIRASSDRQREKKPEDKTAFVSQEELKYLVQVGGVSIGGAAAIKYGSIIFPEITTPNLGQALIMIFAPVLLAVFLLIKQSRLHT